MVTVTFVTLTFGFLLYESDFLKKVGIKCVKCNCNQSLCFLFLIDFGIDV